MNNAKKEQKEEMTRGKRITNIVVTILQVVLIIICFAASIAIIQNPGGYKDKPEDCNTSVMVVMSDSMEPTIGSNAMIFGKDISSAKSIHSDTLNADILDLGTVVTFAVKKGAGYYLNTHRIVGYVYWANAGTDNFSESKVYYVKGSFENYDDFKKLASAHSGENWTLKGYVTRGDKYSLEYGADIENGNYTIYEKDGSIDYTKDDSSYRSIDEDANDKVLAVWQGGKIEGVGAVIKFLQTPTYFALCILLPLVILFIYNIVLVVKMIIADKSEKAKKAALEELKNNAIDEEEIKKKAIEEYLASLEKKKESEEPKTE